MVLDRFDKHIYPDTRLSGLGGSLDNFVYIYKIPSGFNGYTIVHLEMVNILVALKIRGKFWENKKNKN